MAARVKKTHIFDFIIVGAGSAGCVLANRLSADANVRVLLIEAGGRDWDPLIHIPGGNFVFLVRGIHCWRYMTAPQAALNNRRLYDPRGKVLGGTSSINGMIYDRGSYRDCDGWADMGAKGWSYAEVLPYFKRSENFEPGGNHYHGGDGPMRATRARIAHPLAVAWLEACQQAGIPFNGDFNGVDRVGVGPTQMTAYRGLRMSTAVAFLKAAKRRPNLEILTHAHVTRIHFEGARAVGVELLRDGQVRQLRAERETILSAGVYNTPHLLMLSGVGDGDHLRSLGIKVVAANAGVGTGLQDHMAFALQTECTIPISLNGYFNNPLKSLDAAREYIFHRRGPLATPPVEVITNLSTEHAPADYPDIKITFVAALYDGNGQKMHKRHGFLTRGALLRPESRGTVRLSSADPFAPAILNANYYSAEADRRSVRAAYRVAREIHAQAGFAGFRGAEIAPGKDVVTDDQIDAFVRATAPVDMHAVGSCPMGTDGALDENLRVRGVEGLRVADASAMPRIIGGNTNAATIMMAEKAADMIAGRSAPAPIPRVA